MLTASRALSLFLLTSQSPVLALMQVTLVAVNAPSPFVGRDSSLARYSLGVACTLRVGQVTFVLGSGSFSFAEAWPPPPAGRVARAGRSGTAYSLVAPDEVPYLLDLHLFLGRALTLAHPNKEPSGTWRLGWGWGHPQSSWFGQGTKLSWLRKGAGLGLTPGEDPCIVIPQYLRGIGHRTPADTKIKDA